MKRLILGLALVFVMLGLGGTPEADAHTIEWRYYNGYCQFRTAWIYPSYSDYHGHAWSPWYNHSGRCYA